MKVQVSFREVKKNCGLLIALPDDGDQMLEKMFGQPFAYAAGIFGWNADFFRLPHGVVVAAGYRPQGKRYDYDRLKMWYEVFKLCRTEEERDEVRYAIASDMCGESPLQEHHSALARGYVSRKGIAYKEAYRGRFGIGVKVHHPSYGMTSHHHITYYTL